jgi:hypothetical protein
MCVRSTNSAVVSSSGKNAKKRSELANEMGNESSKHNTSLADDKPTSRPAKVLKKVAAGQLLAFFNSQKLFVVNNETTLETLCEKNKGWQLTAVPVVFHSNVKGFVDMIDIVSLAYP